MNVLHIYKNYFPVIGGIEGCIRSLAEDQASRGLDVTVLVASGAKRTSVEMLNGVRVVRAGSLVTMARTPLSPSMPWWIAHIDSHVTHLHFPYPAGELAYLLSGTRGKLVITYHADIVGQKVLLRGYELVLRRLLARADRITATSPNLIESSRFLSSLREKCEIVPYGIDIERFCKPRESANAIRAQYEGPLVLFVGRLRYFKGLEYLIEAMRQVQATLLVIGKGPEEERFKHQVSSAGLDRRVLFLGELSGELPAFYQAADLFVLPSSHRNESFGIVLIEAMAAGKPVISTELGTGTSWINVHGHTGVVVPPRDPPALARAIRSLLDDKSARIRMGRNARERAVGFSAHAMSDRIAAVYDSVLGHNRTIAPMTVPPANDLEGR